MGNMGNSMGNITGGRIGDDLERSLIVERVKAGLRNARAKGKRLGRPRKVLNTALIAALRAKALDGSESQMNWRLGSERFIDLR